MTWNKNEKTCWSKNTVEEIAAFDAFHVSKGVFKATHHPLPLLKRSAGQLPGQGVQSSEQSLVDEFYKKTNKEGLILVAITGPSGVGKSHLVRLLHVQRPENDNLHIAYIPKVDTNLRGSIERILADLGSEFDSVRDLLKTANNAETSLDLNSRKFLDAVAQLMREDLETKKTFYSLEEQNFLEQIPNLLTDPQYRSTMIEIGGPQRICSRPQGIPSKSNDENSTQFLFSDLPFSDIDSSSLSAPAKKIYTQMSGLREYQESLVHFLNKHFVERAISDVYWNKGPKLTSVMHALREILYTQGKELVLLIEDLVSFTGVRRDLLDAMVTTDTDNPDGIKTISPLRVAFAMTDGAFREIFDTLQTRLKSIYALNLPISDRLETLDSITTTFTSDEQLQFISRYLNASRLSTTELDDFANSTDLIAPNTCVSCEVRENCHQDFGALEGVGLYPFNKSAITKLTRGLDPHKFTPRFIVRDFIAHVLLEFDQEISSNTFPSMKLIERFENSENINIPNEELIKLKNSLGNHNDFERFSNLQKFWSNDFKQLQKWPDWMRECFGLSELTVGEVKPTEPPVTTGNPLPPPPIKQKFDWTEFDKWSNDSASLPAHLASIIRTSLYHVVVSELENRYRVNTTKPYFSLADGTFLRRDSFRIKDAEGSGLDRTSYSFATFEIQKTIENAVLLQRLISQSEHGENINHWSDIDKYLEYLSWIDSIVISFHNQFLTTYPDSDLQIQFLLIGNALLGRSNTTDVDMVHQLLQDPSDLSFEKIVAGRTRQWVSEIKNYADERTIHLANVKAMLGTQKGIGATLSTRLASRLAQIQSSLAPFGEIATSGIDVILQKKIATHQKNIISLANIEQTNSKQEIKEITEELSGTSIQDLIRDIRAVTETITRSFPGKIFTQAESNELMNLLTDILSMKSIDLTEANYDFVNIEDILKVLSNHNYEDLTKFRQTLSHINQRLLQILEIVESIADAAGVPTKLTEEIEDQILKLEKLILELL